MRFRCILVLLATCFIAWPATGQEIKASIQGALTDDTGGVLPGAMIEALNTQKGTKSTAYTDHNGSYRFPALEPGDYEITASMQGFASSRMTNIEIKLGQIIKVDMTLRIGGLSETIDVTDESPLIDITQSAASLSIRDEMIEKLPKGRDFTSVVTQSASANNEENLGGISIDGASGSENRFIINGIDTTDLQEGISAQPLITDFIDEVQVKSSGYAAEFGGATGGVINVITKSGGNDWSGTIGGYLTTDNWNGDRRKSLRIDPESTGADVSEYVTYDTDDLTRVEPGFTFGGPIVTDRAWFFAAYQPSLSTVKRTVTFNSVPEDGPQTFTDKTNRHYAIATLSGQFSSKLRGRINGSLAPRYDFGILPSLTGNDSPATDFGAFDTERPNVSVSGNLDFTATNNLHFGMKGGYFTYDTKDVAGVPNEVWHQFVGTNAGFDGIPADQIHPSGFRSIPTNSASKFDKFERTSFSLDGLLFADFAGEHQLKAGVQFDQHTNSVESGYQQQRVLYYWDRTFTNPAGVADRGEFGYYRSLRIVTLGDVSSNNVGLFLQDNWTVNDKLTLNLGIRTEQERVPSFRTDLGQSEDAISFDFGDKMAPRLGFSYDVLGDGDWKVYGSWGLFYDITKLEMPRGSFGGDRWIDYFFTMDTSNWEELGQCDPEVDCPGKLMARIDRRLPSNTPGQETIDPDLKPMKSQEFTIGGAHRLNKTMSIGVRYVHKQLDRTIEDVGIIDQVSFNEVFFIANPGEGIAQFPNGPDCPTCPAQPQADRNYDGVEVEFTKRFSDRWSIHASYLYSRLDGNYSGLASSDEGGRTSPNVNRFFDGLVMSFDETGSHSPVIGRLGTDRPHQMKIQGLYETKWGTSIGVNQYWGSGTPKSRFIDMMGVGLPVFYQGRLTDGRTPTLSQTDLSLTHEWRLGDGSAIQLSLNVLNLFDQDTATDFFMQENQDDVVLSLEEFFGGFNTQAEFSAQGILLDPRFNQANDFMNARDLRFGLKYSF